MRLTQTAFSTSFLLALASFCPTTSAQESGMQWGLSAGMNRYSESEMKLLGPELGLHARTLLEVEDRRLALEGDVFLGRQNYSSAVSGTMRNVTNLETRWRVLGDLWPDTGLSTGLALHTLWNDLRGVTSTGSMGYERKATQFWLPLRWEPGDHTTYEVGTLLRGQHRSLLTEAGKAADINNTQKHGFYLQTSASFGLANGDTLVPYFRYTHLSDSDVVQMGGSAWVEPTSNRYQLGVNWQFSTP